MFNAIHFGKTVSELRRKHNMSQMDIASKMEVSFQAVSNWERGVSMPDISRLPELAQLFSTTVDELLGEKQDTCDTRDKHEADSNPSQNTEPYEPVKIRRLKDNVPTHLARVQEGKHLLSLINGCCAFEYDYDTGMSRDKNQLISNFLQDVQNCIDFSDELDIRLKFEVSNEIDQSLSELSNVDIWVFAARENRIVTGGVGTPDNFPVLIIRILNSNNESIIKTMC